jgi:hypothetical protein
MALTATTPEIHLKPMMPFPQLEVNFTALSNVADFEEKTEVKTESIWQLLNGSPVE